MIRYTRGMSPLFFFIFMRARVQERYTTSEGGDEQHIDTETIAALKDRGFRLQFTYNEESRTGDHICYISDLSKVCQHFPEWRLTYDLNKILDEIVTVVRASGA